MSDTDITVVIADDHPIFLKGLGQVVRNAPGMSLVGESSDGETALRSIRSLQPSVAVLDISMPVLDGIGIAQRLSEENDPTSLIFLTMYREKAILDRALELGVKGYVLKDSAGGEIVRAIRAVCRDEHFISPSLSTLLVERGRKTPGALIAPDGGLDLLSPSELRVLRLIAEYKTNREIADELYISLRTVETHRTHICRKLDLHGAHALMKYALARIDEIK